MRFAGKRFIITGGGGGIGRACARLAGAAGARVALAGRNRGELERAAADLPGDNRTLIYACDVSAEADVHRLFAQVVAAWGGVDGLVNCAAVFRKASFGQLPLEMWQEVLGVNLTGTYLCCREAFRTMRPGGAIVNLASLSGVPGVEKFPGFAAYNVSKYGVIGLTEILGVEGNALGLRVNSISPAAVATPMLQQAAPQKPPALQPEDVAQAVLYLLAAESRAVTGTNLVLFGPPPTPALGGLR